MSNKTKTLENTVVDRAQEIGAQAGFLMMAAAATLGMIEMPEHFNQRVVATAQPAFALVEEHGAGHDNAQRREREETGPHYTSYSVAQRTPGRSGRS